MPWGGYRHFVIGQDSLSSETQVHHHIVRLGSQAASCDHKILRKARKNIARIDRGGHTESKATQNATLLRGRHASGTRQAVGNLPPAGDNRMQCRPHEIPANHHINDRAVFCWVRPRSPCLHSHRPHGTRSHDRGERGSLRGRRGDRCPQGRDSGHRRRDGQPLLTPRTRFVRA